MLRIRRSAERGRTQLDWLDSRHTFSFGDYFDPVFSRFRSLRVMNEDWIAPGMGFGMHGHRDMEIVTLILSGSLEHRDSLGNGSVLKPGDFQRMTAGTGIRHSEFNPSQTETVHLYQIWLSPSQSGLPPGYEERSIDGTQRDGRWQLIASPDGRDGSLTIHQDAQVRLARLQAGTLLSMELAAGRHGWLQVVSGRIVLTGTAESDKFLLDAGDGAGLSEETAGAILAQELSEVLLFDLA